MYTYKHINEHIHNHTHIHDGEIKMRACIHVIRDIHMANSPPSPDSASFVSCKK